jgi:hypothetical protein
LFALVFTHTTYIWMLHELDLIRTLLGGEGLVSERLVPMTLREKQSLFVLFVAFLIGEIHAQGYEATFGETYRRKGVGRDWSLHRKRLAIDINLFKKGKYLTKTEAHKRFGLYWESLGKTYDVPLAWGGRFKKKDGNHYSFSHGGIQ